MSDHQKNQLSHLYFFFLHNSVCDLYPVIWSKILVLIIYLFFTIMYCMYCNCIYMHELHLLGIDR